MKFSTAYDGLNFVGQFHALQPGRPRLPRLRPRLQRDRPVPRSPTPRATSSTWRSTRARTATSMSRISDNLGGYSNPGNHIHQEIDGGLTGPLAQLADLLQQDRLPQRDRLPDQAYTFDGTAQLGPRRPRDRDALLAIPGTTPSISANGTSTRSSGRSRWGPRPSSTPTTPTTSPTSSTTRPGRRRPRPVRPRQQVHHPDDLARQGLRRDAHRRGRLRRS